MGDRGHSDFDDEYGSDEEFDERFARFVALKVDEAKERKAFEGWYW